MIGNTDVKVQRSNTVVNVDVLGGGYGLITDSEIAKITGSTNVEIKEGYVGGNVYGGGDMASVTEDAHVTVSGGTIGRKLYLNERYVDERNNHFEIETGDVYGGGHGLKPTNSNANLANSVTAGRVYGNTYVTVSGGNVRHNVYGGGAMSSVGTFTLDASGNVDSWTSGGKATVEVNGTALIGPKKADLTEGITQHLVDSLATVMGISTLATVQDYIDLSFKYLGGNEGSVYGASRGKADPKFSKWTFAKETDVTVGGTAQVVSGLFGGGENGRVYGNTEVAVEGGTLGGIQIHGTTYTEEDPNNEYYGVTVHLSDDDSEIAEDEFGVGRRIFRGSVFGGGRGSDTYNNLTSTPPQYGLFNPVSGRVYGNTKVTVSGGKIFSNGRLQIRKYIGSRQYHRHELRR